MDEAVRVVDVAAPVKVPKTAELVAAQLRNQIVRGDLREGDALPPETALMAQFGVSRPTLREAFRVLESEALISVRRGARGGARVHIPNGDVAARYAGLVLQYRGTTLKDVYNARKAIELPAVRRLAEQRPPGALEALAANLAAGRASVDSPGELIRLMEEFHLVVVQQAGNQTLAIFAEMLHHIIELHSESYIARWGGAPVERKGAKQGLRTHDRFLELVEAGDADEAETLWARHLDEGAEYVLRGSDAKTVLDLVGR
jgi:DNA-binding FadR family transcriptional regulator